MSEKMMPMPQGQPEMGTENQNPEELFAQLPPDLQMMLIEMIMQSIEGEPEGEPGQMPMMPPEQQMPMPPQQEPPVPMPQAMPPQGMPMPAPGMKKGGEMQPGYAAGGEVGDSMEELHDKIAELKAKIKEKEQSIREKHAKKKDNNGVTQTASYHPSQPGYNQGGEVYNYHPNQTPTAVEEWRNMGGQGLVNMGQLVGTTNTSTQAPNQAAPLPNYMLEQGAYKPMAPGVGRLSLEEILQLSAQDAAVGYDDSKMQYAKGGEVLKRIGVSGYNKPKRTPGHATKSHVVVAKSGDTVKTIRFGQQGVRGAGKNPKSEKDKARKRSYYARHNAQDANPSKLSARYWSHKVKW